MGQCQRVELHIHSLVIFIACFQFFSSVYKTHHVVARRPFVARLAFTQKSKPIITIFGNQLYLGRQTVRAASWKTLLVFFESVYVTVPKS